MLFIAPLYHFSFNSSTPPLSIQTLSDIMNSLHSVGAAALQRHRIREKMSSILLEHDPSAATESNRRFPFASSSYRCDSSAVAFGNNASVPIIDDGRKYTSQHHTTAQSGGQDTAEVATPKTMPFPDPASKFIGLEGIIFSSEAWKKNSPPSQLTAGVTEDNKCRKHVTASLRRSFSVPKSSMRRGTKRHFDDKTNSSTHHAMEMQHHLGNVYDMQLDRRAMKSSKRKKAQHHAVPPTTRDRKMEEGSEASNDAATSPLSPVKRCLYQNDDEEEEELLTPTKMAEDDEMNDSHPPVDQSDDDDPFATIGHFLRL